VRAAWLGLVGQLVLAPMEQEQGLVVVEVVVAAVPHLQVRQGVAVVAVVELQCSTYPLAVELDSSCTCQVGGACGCGGPRGADSQVPMFWVAKGGGGALLVRECGEGLV
jgi:hypothetical protein